MSSLLTKIAEALEDGRYREEPRSQFAKREPLPNYFDCLDGHTASSEDPAGGAVVEPIINRIQKEGV